MLANVIVYGCVSLESMDRYACMTAKATVNVYP